MDSGYGRMLGAPPLTHIFGSQYFLSSYSVPLTVPDFRKSQTKTPALEKTTFCILVEETSNSQIKKKKRLYNIVDQKNQKPKNNAKVKKALQAHRKRGAF